MTKLSFFTALFTAALIGIATESVWSDEARPNAAAVQRPVPMTGFVPGRYPPPPNRGWQAQPWQQPSQWPAPPRAYYQSPPRHLQRGQYRAYPAAPMAAGKPHSSEFNQIQPHLTAKSTAPDKTLATLAQLRAKLQHSLETEGALNEELADLTSKQQTAQAHIKELNEKLNTTTTALEQNRQNISNDQQRNQQLTAERDRLRSDLTSRDKQLAAMQAKLQTATQALLQARSGVTTASKQLSNARTQNETLKIKLGELVTEVGKQKTELLKAEQARTTDQDSLRSELASRKKQLTTLQTELQTATQALQQARTEAATSGQQLNKARAQNETLNNKLSTLSNLLMSQKTTLLKAEKNQAADRDSLRSELASRDKRLAALQTELQTATQALQQARSETTLSSQQLSEAWALNETFKTRLRKLETKTEEQKTRLEETEKTLTEATADRKGLQTDLAACSRELAQARDALTDSQSEMDTLRSSCAPVTEPVVTPTPGGSDKVKSAVNEGAAEVAAMQITDTDDDGVADSDDLCLDTRQNDEVDSTGCTTGVAINLEDVNFLYNSHKLTIKARRILNHVADILIKLPEMHLEVAGHTDSQGDPSYNQWLSLKRAETVRDYLVERGVGTHRIDAAGYGGQRPIANNLTRQGLRTNRRVELRRLH